MKYAKSAGKLMRKIGAFEVLNFLRAKKNSFDLIFLRFSLFVYFRIV